MKGQLGEKWYDLAIKRVDGVLLMTDPTELYATELATYAKHRDELLATDAGRYVLLYKDQIAGIYDTEMDAIDDGRRRFGLVPIFVKQIVEVERPIRLTSSYLKL